MLGQYPVRESLTRFIPIWWESGLSKHVEPPSASTYECRTRDKVTWTKHFPTTPTREKSLVQKFSTDKFKTCSSSMNTSRHLHADLSPMSQTYSNEGKVTCTKYFPSTNLKYVDTSMNTSRYLIRWLLSHVPNICTRGIKIRDPNSQVEPRAKNLHPMPVHIKKPLKPLEGWKLLYPFTYLDSLFPPIFTYSFSHKNLCSQRSCMRTSHHPASIVSQMTILAAIPHFLMEKWENLQAKEFKLIV